MNAFVGFVVTVLMIATTVVVYLIAAHPRGGVRWHIARGLIVAALYWVVIARPIIYEWVKWQFFSPLPIWWLIAALVLIVAAFLLGRAGFMAVAIALVVGALLISWLAPLGPLFNRQPTQVAAKSVAQANCEKEQGKFDLSSNTCFITQLKAATPLLKQVPGNCIGGHNVVLDSNAGNRIISDGVSADPKKAVAGIMTVGGHDPRVLQLYWNGPDLKTPLAKRFGPIRDVKQLVDTKTGCYTQAAANDYERLIAVYETAITVKTVIPATDTNTGASSKGGVFQEAGVSGATSSRAGFKVTFSNGDVVFFLRRCGNLVSPAPMVTIPVKPTPVPQKTAFCKPGVPVGSPMCINRRKPPVVCTSGKCSPSGPPIMTNPLLPPVVAGPNKPTDTPAVPGTNENPGPTGCGGPCPTPSPRPTTTPPPVIPPENGTPPPVNGTPAPAPTTQIPPPVV